MSRGEDQTEHAALETDVERLLSVDPTPEFNARVRLRVSREAIAPAPFEQWRWLVLRGAVIAAVCVAVLMLVVRMNRAPKPEAATQVRSIPQVPLPTSPAGAQTTRSTGNDAPAVATSVGSRVRSRASDTRAVTSVASVEPPVVTPAARDPFSDVQVSASELKALRQIAMLMEGKRLELDERTPTAAVRDDVKELVITPITIEPIQLVMIKGDAE